MTISANPPFIGITGFTSITEVIALQTMTRELGLDSSRRLAIGVLASYRGLAFNEPADPAQYVPVSELSGLMIRERQFLNMVHYNSRADGLPRQIHHLLKHATYADGAQLNIVWPKPEQLERLRWETYAPIILQVGQQAYQQPGGNPESLVRRLTSYVHYPYGSLASEPFSLVDYVLIDPSGGLGRPFDPVFASDVLLALVESGLPMRWGMTGGLGPDNVQEKIGPLLGIYPELCWDAQSRLRTTDKAALDLPKCRDYLAASIELVRNQAVS